VWPSLAVGGYLGGGGIGGGVVASATMEVGVTRYPNEGTCGVDSRSRLRVIRSKCSTSDIRHEGSFIYQAMGLGNGLSLVALTIHHRPKAKSGLRVIEGGLVAGLLPRPGWRRGWCAV
jgi:hypothetical protein